MSLLVLSRGQDCISFLIPEKLQTLFPAPLLRASSSLLFSPVDRYANNSGPRARTQTHAPRLSRAPDSMAFLSFTLTLCSAHWRAASMYNAPQLLWFSFWGLTWSRFQLPFSPLMTQRHHLPRRGCLTHTDIHIVLVPGPTLPLPRSYVTAASSGPPLTLVCVCVCVRAHPQNV